VLFARTYLQRFGFDLGRDDQLYELTIENSAGDVHSERSIEGDDAAECGRRIGAIRLFVRGQRIRCNRRAARVGVLDDHAGRFGELAYALERSVAVGDVVVGERLALELASGADAGACRLRQGVERAGLMRVLAVAQVQPLAHVDRSEEHTSELQSRENLVCRLLLEKKNNSR